jgi:hypothetical protein
MVVGAQLRRYLILTIINNMKNNLNNIHSKIIKLFKAGVVNLEGINPIDYTNNDIAYIAPEDLKMLAKKYKNVPITKKGHFDDGIENHQDEIVGKIGDTWVEGDWAFATALLDDEGLNLLSNGKGLSISYKVLKALQNNQKDKKEGIQYDYRIGDLEPDHVAIVDNPRYNGAGLKHNSEKGSDEILICGQYKKHNSIKKTKTNIMLDNKINMSYDNKKLTKMNNMFKIGKKYNENWHETKQTHENNKDNTSKKYLSLEGKRINGMDGEYFKKRLLEAYRAKHNFDLSEDEEALHSLIKIEYDGEEIEMTLKEAMELINDMAEEIAELEYYDDADIPEEKHNNEERYNHEEKHNNEERYHNEEKHNNIDEHHNKTHEKMKTSKHNTEEMKNDFRRLRGMATQLSKLPKYNTEKPRDHIVKENKAIKYNSYADVVKQQGSENNSLLTTKMSDFRQHCKNIINRYEQYKKKI